MRTASDGRIQFISRLLCSFAMLGFFSSCAVHDGGGCPGWLVHQNHPTSIVDREIILLDMTDSVAKVRVVGSRKIHELPLGRHVPIDSSRGLVLCSTSPKTKSAQISGFYITRTTQFLFP